MATGAATGAGPGRDGFMTRFLSISAVLWILASPAPGEEPEPVRTPPARARISVSWTQGFAFLDGGYADAGNYYSAYWDTGQAWALAAAYDFLPVARAGVEVAARDHEDRGHGIGDLHLGHGRLFAEFRLPLLLPARFLAIEEALDAVRGPVVYVRIAAGFGLVDPTSTGAWGIFDRTFTWSAGACAGVEYRLEEISLGLEFGADLLGAPAPSGAFKANPDPILSFPVAVALRIHLP